MFLDSEITPTATSTPTVQLTEKILKEAYEQQKEVEDEENAPMSTFSQQSLYEVEEVLDDDVDVFEIQLDYKDMACSEKEENLLLDALLSQGRGFNSRTCLGCITTSTNQLEDKDVAATGSAYVSETNYYPKVEEFMSADTRKCRKHLTIAALVCLAEMEFLSTRSYFMKTISEKKYALPHLAIDAVAAHFLRFRRETKVMPVIWYQTLLAFVQRYSHELRKEDKKSLPSLLEKQNHELITLNANCININADYS
ncbi:hypothetical protein HID58_086939 [Brassica napus]|uniref:Cyclin N-terminal domain-containing protein n=1 Tax=Brassica napus TaxID=3708 RepID=A0ABQ7XRZ1_BRANA|nr:hypothetical protein HID58_086939 [Brassica napus]